ncbi:MAG: hypothetical protein NVSMB4_00570 [Acidimicrobiales bacterium]
MAGSSVPAAVAYLLANIVTQVADTKVLIEQGTAGTNNPNDMILVGETVNRTLTFDDLTTATATGAVAEHFTITVRCSSFLGGDTPGVAFSRVYVLADAVVAVLRSDPTLGGAVASCAAEPVVADATDDWDVTGKGRLAEILFQVTCDAYI